MSPCCFLCLSQPLAHGGPWLVLPQTMNQRALMMHRAHQLGSSLLKAPHSFFSTQHPDPLHFYPWVLRNRFFGHCLQGECPFSASDPGMPGRLGSAAQLFKSCWGQVLGISLDSMQAITISLWSVVLGSHLGSEIGTSSFPRNNASWDRRHR